MPYTIDWAKYPELGKFFDELPEGHAYHAELETLIQDVAQFAQQTLLDALEKNG